jgi:hypothetical protein
MKTLIIHPQDSSTSFLDIVYAPIENKTVITGGISKSEVQQLIREHDRVMMMGHGSPGGLFNIHHNSFTNCGNGYIIDQQMVPLLNEKDNSVFIWCNADKFVDMFKLKGFYSGMFISEVGEANYCSKDFPINSNEYIKLRTTTQEEVDESNYGFVNIIAKYINDDKELIHENVKKEYGLIAENNSVALYNNNRLYKS